MAMEERILFPAVLNALRSEDWADVALQLADRYGSLYQSNFEEKFSTLRRNILEMEEEAKAERPHEATGYPRAAVTGSPVPDWLSPTTALTPRIRSRQDFRPSCCARTLAPVSAHMADLKNQKAAHVRAASSEPTSRRRRLNSQVRVRPHRAPVARGVA